MGARDSVVDVRSRTVAPGCTVGIARDIACRAYTPAMGDPHSDLPARARTRASSLTDTEEGRTFFGADKRAARPQRVVLDELRASRESLTLSADELRALRPR